MLFNKNNNGMAEIRKCLGFIDASSSFSTWESYIELSVRQLTAFIGTEIYEYALNYYNAPAEPTEPADPAGPAEPTPEVMNKLVQKIQMANALFAYTRLLPSLDAGHSNSGRKKELGENEKSLTAAEAYKDENNILVLAYEATDAIIHHCIKHNISAFVDSPKARMAKQLLLPSVEAFNEYFVLNSARMYYSIVPIIREMQRTHILSVYKQAMLTNTIDALSATTPTPEQTKLIEIAQNFALPALALHSMATAAERLPVEVFPTGVLTSQIVGTVHERRNADKDAVQAFISNNRKQAEKYCKSLQDEVALLLNPATKPYVMQPKSVGKGFRF